MFCPNCGLEATQKTKFCKQCGATLNPTANTVEIHMPKPRVTAMVITIAAFCLIGLITTLAGFSELSHSTLPGGGVIVGFLASLFFIFSIAGLLVWQLSRLIGTYQEAVRQTIHKAQFEPASPQPVMYPPVQPVYIPAPKDPLQSSVTEHTTRQMAAGYRDSRVNE